MSRKKSGNMKNYNEQKNDAPKTPGTISPFMLMLVYVACVTIIALSIWQATITVGLEHTFYLILPVLAIFLAIFITINYFKNKK